MRLITDIHNTLPGYVELGEQLERVQRQLSDFHRAAPATGRVATPLSLAAEAIMQAAKSDALPDVTTIVSDTLRRNEAIDMTAQALVEAERMLKFQRTAVIATGTPTVLAALGDAMTQLQQEAETLAPLRQIATPEAAMASERFEDARRLQQILSDYAAIRTEQVRILRDRIGEDFAAKKSIAAFVSNVDEIFPLWAVWLSHGYLEHRHREDRRPVAPPWPSRAHSDHATFALWALQHGARLWVPSLEEYQSAAAALRERATQPRTPHNDGDWIDPASLPTKDRRPGGLTHSGRG